MYKTSYLHGNVGGNKIANTTGQFMGLEIDALPQALLLAHITIFKRYILTHKTNESHSSNEWRNIFLRAEFMF